MKAGAGLGSPDWLLAGFDPRGEPLHLARVSRQTYRDSAFLDHRIRPLPSEVRSEPGTAVDSLLRDLAPAPASYLLHTGFCCSTLLVSCLDQPGSTLVLREPLVLSRLADALRQPGRLEASDLALLTDRCLGLLDRSYPGERVIVKPSNFANALVPRLFEPRAAATQRRFVVLSSSLSALLVSILKKQDEAEQILPGFLAALLRDSDYAAVTSLPDPGSLSLLQQGLVFWHCQRHAFQHWLCGLDSGRALPLTMEVFLADPLAALQAVRLHLGLPLDDEVLRQVVVSGALARHSKRTGLAYGPGQQAQEAREVLSLHAGGIREVLAWGRELLQAAPPRPWMPGEDPLGLTG